MADIVGYFAWMKGPKGPMPQKYEKDRVGLPRNWIRHGEPAYLDAIIKEHPLTEAEWSLSLDDLAAKYPAPPPSD